MQENNPQETKALTVAQLGIWVSQMLEKNNPAYNMGEVIEILGPINTTTFIQSCNDVVTTTDALHLRFIDTPHGPRQYVDPNPTWDIPYFDLCVENNSEKLAYGWMQKAVSSTVDLTNGPIFKLALFKIAKERYFLYAFSHHICNDGFGAAIFIKQLSLFSPTMGLPK